MQAAVILQNCLVPVAKEAFAAVVSLQQINDTRPCALNELFIRNGERGETDHGKRGGVHLF